MEVYMIRRAYYGDTFIYSMGSRAGELAWTHVMKHAKLWRSEADVRKHLTLARESSPNFYRPEDEIMIFDLRVAKEFHRLEKFTGAE